jgi:SAM-dependent methyltransferase
VISEGHRVTRGAGAIEGFLARHRVRQANRLIPPTLQQGRVLDVGHGAFPLFLSQAGFAERHGIDRISAQARADWEQHDLRLVHQDLELDCRLPYPNDHFAAVTMLAVFEHIPPGHLGELLAEVHRVLEPGGVYVMTTPAAWTGRLLAVMATLRLVSHDEIDEHQGSYGHHQIRAALQAAGFKPDRIRLGYFEVFANNWSVATK